MQLLINMKEIISLEKNILKICKIFIVLYVIYSQSKLQAGPTKQRNPIKIWVTSNLLYVFLCFFFTTFLLKGCSRTPFATCS
jgi:hypothetical protein